METTAIIVASFLCLLPVVTGHSIITRIPVGFIDEGESIILASQMDKYTDIDKGLTAVKDSNLVSCYIKETDPFWNPGPSDKQEIMRTNEPETITSMEDEFRLRKKAGDTISEMCKAYRIYWATLPPPPMLPQQPGNRFLPPPAMRDQVDLKAPPTIGAPVDSILLPEEIQGILDEHDGNGIGEIPRIYNSQDRSNGDQMKTPPPVAIYQQQHQHLLSNLLNPRQPVDGSIPQPPLRENPGNLLVKPPLRGAPPMIQDVFDGEPPKMPGEPPKIPGEPPKIPGEPPRLPPPPPLMPMEREVMLEPPMPNMDKPEMKSPEVDEIAEVRAPPPLDVWRRMLVSIKETETLAPPPPDMRSPEFKSRS